MKVQEAIELIKALPKSDYDEISNIVEKISNKKTQGYVLRGIEDLSSCIDSSHELFREEVIDLLSGTV